MLAQCAIIMFDVTERASYANIAKWYKDVERICGDIPVAIVGNKVESKDRKVAGKAIAKIKKPNVKYFEVSTKEEIDAEKPFLWLIQQIKKNAGIKLVPVVEVSPRKLLADVALEKGKEEKKKIKEDEKATGPAVIVPAPKPPALAVPPAAPAVPPAAHAVPPAAYPVPPAAYAVPPAAYAVLPPAPAASPMAKP